MSIIKYSFMFLIFHLFGCMNCIDYDGNLNILVQHSVGCGGEQFCHRGTISLKGLRSGVSVIEQQNMKQNHIDELKLLAEIDDFYTIRASMISYPDKKETEYISSIKAKDYLQSGLSDEFHAWILPNGFITAINLQTNHTSQPLKENQKDYPIRSNFFLRHIDVAPVPDTASYIQKLEKEREAREKGDVKDNRSFIAKYWMYIVPVAIFVMISGAANPEGPAQPSR